jgi:MFS family permease
MSESIEETKSPLIENSESNVNSQIIEEESRQSLSLAKEKSQSNVFVLNRKIRWFLFFLFAMLNLLMNFDHGTVPAATEQLKNYLNLSDSELGLFGSLVFIGVIIGSLISLSIINTFNRKYILLLFLMLCGLFLILFTKTKHYILLCIDRIIIGIFQAFISIYLPLWCEQFGVERRKTLMLALIQVVAPLGVLIGYIVTATLNMNLHSLPHFGEIKKDERWLYSFYIQSILIWGLSLYLLFFSNKYFNSKARRVPI